MKQNAWFIIGKCDCMCTNKKVLRFITACALQKLKDRSAKGSQYKQTSSISLRNKEKEVLTFKSLIKAC